LFVTTSSDGTIHAHGLNGTRCPGTKHPPVRTALDSTNSQTLCASVVNRSDFNLNEASNSDFHSPNSPTRIPKSATNQSIPDVHISITDSSLPPRFGHPSLPRPTIKHIPRLARPSCAISLSEVFRKITRNPKNLTAWSDLLSFGSTVLQAPSRAGKRHSLTSTIKKRVALFDSGIAVEQDSNCKGSSTFCKRDSIASVVRSKIEDGNVSAAVRILCSDETLADGNIDTLNKLKEKHPSPPVNRIQAPGTGDTFALQVTQDDVIKAVRSFPSGSAGGPDGIRPQHIRELVTCKESASSFVPALTAFVNCLLMGDCPPEVQPILFGGNLIALNKKSGGIRPITVGYTLRRLAAKCASAFAVANLFDYFHPVQLGAGIPGGCEAAVHAVRRFVESMPSNFSIAKLDFTNAFNTLNRSRMLTEIHKRIPELYKFCHSAYSVPSVLRFGKWVVESQEGVQQGDPLGPILFCLTIHPLLISLKSPLRVGFMDDITLGGDEESLEQDIQAILDANDELSLQLNIPKCELISFSNESSSTSILSSFLKITPANSILLGAPLTPDHALDSCLASRKNDFLRAAEGLKTLVAHDALTILRYALSAPKLLYTLRCCPCYGHPLLDEFDQLYRDCLCSIVNCHLTDDNWSQASLPVNMGGLGIRLVSQLAPSAFLASAVGTRELQDNILVNCGCPADNSISSALAFWSSYHSSPAPAGSDARLQQNWDNPVLVAVKNHLLESTTEATDRARLLAVSSRNSSDWLHALPIASCGLLLDDEAVRVAIGFRLGAKVCEPHICVCGSQVDARGIHCLSCKRSSGRISRHNNINDIICRALIKAGVPAKKEPVGLSRSDGKRPDGLTLIPWCSGRCAVWDVTVVDTLAKSYINVTTSTTAGAAELAHTRKMSKYLALSSSYEVIPVAIETLGPMNSTGAEFIRDLGRKMALQSGDPRETGFLWQRLSIALQRFNAVCFRGCFESDFSSLS